MAEAKRVAMGGGGEGRNSEAAVGDGHRFTRWWWLPPPPTAGYKSLRSPTPLPSLREENLAVHTYEC